MPPAVVERPKATDRHKPRKSLGLPPKLHGHYKHLAAKNRRPLRWELITVLEDHLRDLGIDPSSTPAPFPDDDDDD